MFVAILLLCLLIIPTGYFLYSLVYPFIDNIFNLQIIQSKRIIIWSSISAGLLSAIKVTLIAVALAIIKRWWLKQKEKEKVEKEKVLTELQLLKAQIHPAFLFSTLNNIIEHAGTASPKSAQMLIKLSDLLSYMLYECDEPEVELEKELNMVKDYMGLEKIRQGERLEMTVRINGDTNRMLITPLILLPFIDNSLSYCNDERLEQAWINLDISIVDNNLFLKVINGLPDGIAKEINNNDQKLVNVQKRLQLLYPGRHEIKINAEQELLMMCLNLKLGEATPINHMVVEITKPVLGYAGI